MWLCGVRENGEEKESLLKCACSDVLFQQILGAKAKLLLAVGIDQGQGVAPLIRRPTSSYGLISTSPKLLCPICPQHFLLLTTFTMKNVLFLRVTMKNVLKLGKSTATSLDFQCVRTSALKQEYSTSNALSSDTLNPASSQQRCGCHATIHATLSLSLYTTQSRLSPVGGLFSYYSKQVGS
jgi:hypothetical protein